MVEGARLESVCTGYRTVGSNPTLSAKNRPATAGHVFCAHSVSLTDTFSQLPQFPDMSFTKSLRDEAVCSAL